MNALLSLLFWSEIAVFAVGGFLVQAPLFLLTVPFDRTRRINGRFLRLIGVVTARVSPFWDFGVYGPLPQTRPGKTVVVSNHVSNADVFLISCLPWEMKWLSKASMFKVPVFGWSMWMAGDIPVHRGERGSGREALAVCARWLEKGMPVMIFPEGTRSRTGQLGEFKDGAFRLAIETGADILPIAVAGTHKALPKHSWKFARSKGLVTVGTPIPTTGMTVKADLERLKAQVRAEIERLYATIAPLSSPPATPNPARATE